MLAGPNRTASSTRKQARQQRKQGTIPQTRSRAATVPVRAQQPSSYNTNQGDDLLSFGLTSSPSPSPQPQQPQQPQQQQQQQQSTSDDLLDLFGFGTTATTTPSPSPEPVEQKQSSKQLKPKKKKKKDKTTTRQRAQTEAARSPPSEPAPPPPKKKKLKTIDVLPLLHKGVRMNKFKFQQGGKPKARTFFLTQDNKYWCWEATGVGGTLVKSAEERQIYLAQIREVRRNSAQDVRNLNDIRNKAFTVTLIYDYKGADKQLNMMAFNPFHYQMVVEALEKLVEITRSRDRDLGNIFELYLDFQKDILPEHLRPTRFKWEALKDDEIQRDRSTTVPVKNEETMDVFFPGGRDRVQSF